MGVPASDGSAMSASSEPRGFDQLDRGLLAHAGNAGKIIRWIALEPTVIRELIRLQLETLVHCCRIVASQIGNAAPRRQHGRVFVDDLQQIEIAGHDQRLLAHLFGLARERRNDVVGFLPLDLDDRNVMHREHIAHQRELAAQIVRHRVPLRFIFLIKRHAIDRQSLVERGDHVRRLFVMDELVEHHRETIDRVDRHAADGRQRRQRKECTVHQTVGIKQHQAAGAFTRHQYPAFIDTAFIAPLSATMPRSPARRR